MDLKDHFLGKITHLSLQIASKKKLFTWPTQKAFLCIYNPYSLSILFKVEEVDVASFFLDDQLS